jgi:hypothetical protein
MDITQALEAFRRATQHCDNLVMVHRGYGGPGLGRRSEEVSLNRAVIVLAVASWQAVVQDLTFAALDLSAPSPASGMTSATYAVLAGRVRTEIGAFATPNAENSRKLLIAAGFDPRPHWTWRQGGGRGVGMITITPQNVDTRVNEWLRVRHAIAHGHAQLPQVAALQAVRAAPANPPADPTIRLLDAEQCLTFFRRVTSLTTRALAGHLGVPAP